MGVLQILLVAIAFSQKHRCLFLYSIKATIAVWYECSVLKRARYIFRRYRKILVINLCHEMEKVVNHWYVKRARTISIILALRVAGHLV